MADPWAFGLADPTADPMAFRSVDKSDHKKVDPRVDHWADLLAGPMAKRLDYPTAGPMALCSAGLLVDLLADKTAD
jgi:hypothetical protein